MQHETEDIQWSKRGAKSSMSKRRILFGFKCIQGSETEEVQHTLLQVESSHNISPCLARISMHRDSKFLVVVWVFVLPGMRALGKLAERSIRVVY